MILTRAFEVTTMFSQSRLGVWVGAVTMETVSPLFKVYLIGTFFSFTFAETHLHPNLVWIAKAKSSTVAPLARLDQFACRGEDIDLVFVQVHLEILHQVERVVLFRFHGGTDGVQEFVQPAFLPFLLYISSERPVPRSAISSMRRVRICTSTHLFCGPITVICRLS